MRVLHVLHNSLPLVCGYSMRSAAILRHQQRQGIETFVGTSPRQPDSPSDCVDQIEVVAHLRTAAPRTPPLPFLRERSLMRALQRRVDEAIEAVRPDIVHAHSPVLVGLPALRAARDHGLPFVYEVRDLWENASVDRGKFRYNSPLYRLARRVETDVLRRADAVVAICESLRDDLSSRVEQPERLFVVGNGVDVDEFQPQAVRDDRERQQWGLAGKEVIAYVGTFQPYEGLDVLIRALPRVLVGRPRAHLVIAGGAVEGHNAVEAALRALVDRLEVGAHVTFTGRLPHSVIAGIYRMADLVAYPRTLTRTTALTTPLKPLEAMAAGCAVVASDLKPIRELIEHDVTGLTCEAGQPESLAQACLDLLFDPDLRRRLGTSARAWTVRERQWPSIVSRYRAIYDGLVERESFMELTDRSMTAPAALSA